MYRIVGSVQNQRAPNNTSYNQYISVPFHIRFLVELSLYVKSFTLHFCAGVFPVDCLQLPGPFAELSDPRFLVGIILQ